MLRPIGKATISNDGATIMKLLDIVHPAAKTLVEIAKSQDAEVEFIFSCIKMSHSVTLAMCLRWVTAQRA